MKNSRDFQLFAEMLLSPFRQLKDKSEKWQKQNQIRARMTGQVIVMQFRLNELYDTNLRRIEIRDHFKSRTPYIYMVSELDAPLYLPCHLTNDAYDSDFVVRIPQSLMSQYNSVVHRVLIWKLPSRRFVVETF